MKLRSVSGFVDFGCKVRSVILLGYGLREREAFEIIEWQPIENCFVRLVLSSDFEDLCRECSHPLSVKGYILAVRANNLWGVP